MAAGVYPPDIGGPATLAVLLERELPQRGVQVTVIPFHVVRSLPKVIRHVVYTYRLWRQARHATHIFALDGVSVGLPALIVSSLRRKPLIVRLGGDYAWEQGRARFGVTASLDEFDATKEHRAVRALASLQSFVCRRAARVIVPSQYLKDMVVRWLLRPDTVQVIHSVFSPPRVPNEITEPSARPYIVSAGRLVPWKGFIVLIETVAALRATFNTLTLDIFGDGEYRSTLESLITTLGAEDFVHLRGKVDAVTLHTAVASADTFVLNTGYEGLSHQLLEVMALRVPIITTDIGGNRELLTDEVEALLIPYNDRGALEATIRRILTDDALRLKLTDAAASKVNNFSAESAITSYVQLFSNTV